MVCSHNHKDHLNLETLLPMWQANPKVRFIVPEPERECLTAGGIAPEAVIGAKAGEAVSYTHLGRKANGYILKLFPGMRNGWSRRRQRCPLRKESLSRTRFVVWQLRMEKTAARHSLRRSDIGRTDR